MLAVMVIERLGRHEFAERGLGKGQIDQLKRHVARLLNGRAAARRDRRVHGADRRDHSRSGGRLGLLDDPETPQLDAAVPPSPGLSSLARR